MMGRSAPTAFVGLSHLGIVSSVGWSSFGQPVIGLDLDVRRVEQLGRGDLPIREPGLPELWERCRRWLMFSADPRRLADCPLVIVAQDVPTDAENASDLTPVVELIDAIVPHLRSGVVLTVMSQVPPGFTRRLAERIRSARPELTFELYYLVETLIFGDAVRRCLEPERFIVGCPDPQRPLPEVLMEGLRRFGCPILPMSYESAELTKLAINLYLIGSVTYANALSDLCEAIGADWGDIVPALRLDRRIGPAAYLRPGLGIAGGNLERDLVNLRALGQAHGVDTSYLDILAAVNTRRYQWISRKLGERVLAPDTAPTVGIWGLTYKRNTDSTKNAPALRLIGELAGRASIRAWDPAVRTLPPGTPVSLMERRDAVLDGADCLAIMVDWDDFADADLEAIRRRMRRPLVIDCVGVLEGSRHQMGEIEYVSMGR